jgi:hypothetical protein
MFVAVAQIPSGPAALQRAAGITGLAVADVSRALAGTLPRILLRATLDGEKIVGALEAAGFVAFAADEVAVITDKQRILARNLELSAGGLVAVAGSGERHECPAAAILAFLRGVRLVETSEVIKTVQRKLDLGKALLTSGLSVTKKVETISERTTSTKESFVLIQRRDGRPDIMLYERRCNYQCLGPAILPSTYGNLMTLLARLQGLAPAAPLDDRITRPGFLAGLPLMSLDPVDLAVFLVTKARQRGF